MKTVFYKIIYWPPLNRLLRQNLFFWRKLGITKIMLPPAGKIVISLPENEKIIFETNQTSHLTNILAWHGVFAFEYSRIFFDLVKEMDVFFDIGANIGFYSLLAFKSNDDINVYAFEPATGPFEFLKRNINLNVADKRIHIYKLALSNNIGLINFYEYSNPKYGYLGFSLGGESSQITASHLRGVKKTEIESTTLEEFVKSIQLNNIDIIKIDTEGTEDLILEKASVILTEMRPIIICETLFNKIEYKLDSLMKKNNYLFFNHLDNQLVKVDTIIRLKDNGVRDCFFVPKEKENLVTKYLNRKWE